MKRGLVNLAVGVVFVFGGLSGQLVFRGFGEYSSLGGALLAFAGGILALLGVTQLVQHYRALGQETKLPKEKTDWTEWAFRAVVLLLLVLIFIPLMGSFGLWDPWETHYGEVGRQMVERGDWVSPWWGSHWRDGSGHAEGRYFFSKPVFLLWSMGIGLLNFGFTEWGIRLGVALIVILASLMIYIMGKQVFSRRAGIIMMLVTSTSPFWAMLGRQAQTDMPLVGLLTIGMCFFMMACFGKERDKPAQPLDYALFFAVYLLLFIPQMQLLWVKFPLREELSTPIRLTNYGVTQVIGYSLGVLIVLATLLLSKKPRTKRQFYILAFYLFVALATLAKGALGFALPGAIILVYLFISREWGLLKRVELFRGILVFVTIGIPWYGAMVARHGREWYDRFIVHDHIRRASSGVHQIDNGSFEHFIRWLGYGLFPWVAFVPGVFGRLTAGRDIGRRTDAQKARLFLVIWAFIAFGLFTLANTKFHHYIFPVVPAITMLIGLYLNDMLSRRLNTVWPLFLAGVGIFVLVGYDLVSEPQHLKNLFTYQYDRMWPELLTPGFVKALTIFFGVGLVAVVLMAFGKKLIRASALALLFATSTGMTVWCLDVYMPQLAVDWSQGYLWETYYGLCTRIEGPEGAPDFKRYCNEPIVAYRLNWRGETYYTQNEVIPCEDDADFRYFLRTNGDHSFYAIMQRGRRSSFTTALSGELRDGVDDVHTENLKFILVRVLNLEDRTNRAIVEATELVGSAVQDPTQLSSSE